jgi:hypothetical protein
VLESVIVYDPRISDKRGHDESVHTLRDCALRYRRQTQAVCDAEQALIARPERASAAEQDCGEQVRIDIADSRAKQPMPADEVEDFLVGSRSALRQIPHGLQYKLALP